MKSFTFVDLDYFSGKKLPIIFLLDVSGSMESEDSMGKKAIEELNKGVNLFLKDILEDEVAANSMDLSIVTFGNNRVDTLVDFGQWKGNEIPKFIGDGNTPMGEGLKVVAKKIEDRKLIYKDYGVDYFQPWVILMTDGEPTDDIEDGKNKFVNSIKERKVSLFTVAMGSNANLNTLRELNPNMEPMKLENRDFKRFFLWLSRSVEENEIDITKYYKS